MPTASSQVRMLERKRRGPSTQTAAAAHKAGHQIVRPAYPEDRRPDQEVAQGAAADAGNRGEEAEGDDVMLAPSCGQGAGRPEHRARRRNPAR